jgi:hypothetical protein
MSDDVSEAERTDLISCRRQDMAFQAALRREVLAGRERACLGPAASTSTDGAQAMRDAVAARHAGR